MNIRIHSFNVSCAGLCCALGSFLAADAREVHSLNGSWDYSFNGGSSGKVAVPHTWNAEDAADGVKGQRGDAKSVNSDAYRRGSAVYSRTLPVAPRPGRSTGSATRPPASIPLLSRPRSVSTPPGHPENRACGKGL